MSTLEEAISYAEHGYPVFPTFGILDGRCSCGYEKCIKDAGKHPRVNAWGERASTDIEQIAKWWTKWPESNIGLPTGERSGVLVLDVDRKNGKDGTLWLDAMRPDIPDGPSAVTPNGGVHLFFKYPAGSGITISSDKVSRGVDVRGDGGYVVVDPSVGLNGVGYLWEDDLREFEPPAAPDWLVEKICSTSKRKGKGAERWRVSTPLADHKAEEIKDALAYVDPDPRDLWLRMGWAIHSEYANEQGYDLWSEWSAQSPKFDPRDQRRTWDAMDSHGGITLSTLFGHAKDGGWPGLDTGTVTVMDMAPNEAERWQAPDVASPEIPAHLLDVPGFVGDLVKWMGRGSYMPLPSLIMGSALATASAVFGRRYVGSTGLRTGLYVLGVAPSGAGKNDTLVLPNRLLAECGWSHIIGGGDISSHVGLVGAVQRNPVRIFYLDEVGQLFRRMGGRRSAGWEATIKDRLLEFYSASQGIWRDREVQGQGEPALVWNPSVTIFGVTTPNVWSDITGSDLTGGLLGRMLVFEAGEEVDDISRINKNQSGAIPSSLSGFLDYESDRAAHQYGEAGDLSTQSCAVPPSVIVPDSPEALEVFNSLKVWEFERRRGLPEHLRAIVVRAVENARKLAMVRALGIGSESPEIDAQDAQWAAEVSQWVCERMIYMAESEIHENLMARQGAEALKMIRETGELGMPHKKLLKRMNRKHGLRARDLKEIITTLQESGLVVGYKLTTAGRSGVVYVALND